MKRSSKVTDDYLHDKYDVSAHDFAESLFKYLERNNLIDKKLRIDFVEITADIIYEAMIETCGQGIS
jgi:hypothetical protein